MTRFKLIFLILYILSKVLNAFDFKAELSFGDALYQEEEWYGAYLQYKKVLFFNPEAAIKKSLILKIGDTYLFGGQPISVFNLIKKYKELGKKDTEFQSELSLLSARAYFYQGKFKKSLALAEPFLSKSFLSDKALKKFLVLAMKSSAAAKPLTSVKNHLQYLGTKLKVRTYDKVFSSLPEFSRKRLKSPILGGLLSLLPGGGQLYAKRPIEALSSFLINGGLITLSVLWFVQDSSLPENSRRPYLTIPLLGLSSLFYLANIYSGINLTLHYNKQMAKDYRQKVNSYIENFSLSLGVRI